MSHFAKKNQTLNSFLANIGCIADRNYQERVWVRAEGPECDDIDDTICDFFDESYVIEKYKDFGITDEFKVYSGEKSTAQLIQLPQWKEIIETSKKVLHSFNFNEM